MEIVMPVITRTSEVAQITAMTKEKERHVSVLFALPKRRMHVSLPDGVTVAVPTEKDQVSVVGRMRLVMN